MIGKTLNYKSIPQLILGLALVVVCTLISCTAQSGSKPPVSGYDVFLLVGQSNMVGNGRGPDMATDAAVSPRVWQWNGSSTKIAEARDPLFQNQTARNGVGLGMTFAKAYLSNNSVGHRNVLLVGSAANNTTFVSGRWQAPNGDLYRAAVQRANAAMAVAGPDARFGGILWLQGEGDIMAGGAPTYEANLLNLISYFRANIKGASRKTPFVVGEMNREWLTSNLNDLTLSGAQNTILNVFHTLPDKVPYTAWVSSAQLAGDEINGILHFSALSERELGRRYAAKLFEAANNLPQPLNAQDSVSYFERKISRNASFTKMTWFKPGAIEESRGAAPAKFDIEAALIEAGRPSSPLSTSASDWRNITLVYNGSAKTTSIYLNGLPTATKRSLTVVPMLLDQHRRAGVTSWNAEFAGNRSWNVALTPSQISAIYQYELNHLENY